MAYNYGINTDTNITAYNIPMEILMMSNHYNAIKWSFKEKMYSIYQGIKALIFTQGKVRIYLIVDASVTFTEIGHNINISKALKSSIEKPILKDICCKCEGKDIHFFL